MPQPLYVSRFNAYRPQQADYVNYAIQMIMFIVSQVGPREPGSPAERRAAEFFMADLRNYASDGALVYKEEFIVHPWAFESWVWIDSLLMIAAVFFYNFKLRILAFILTFMSAVFMITQFILYWEFIDPLFPGYTSQNVIAIRKPKGEVKRRAVFNGHIDSQYEWWYNYLLGGHGLAAVIVAGLVGVLGSLILQIVFCKEYKNWLALVFMGTLPIYAVTLWFVNWNIVVPGANDNLTGCLCATSVLKYLADNNIEFENTEVQVVLTGCEEAGLRGAKAWAKAHQDYLTDGIETAFFCFDTIRDLPNMAVYYRDMTGTVKNDDRVTDIMRRAGELAGLQLPLKILFCGSSDAAAISQGGIPASLFAAMDPTPANYYHTRNDAIDDMEPQAMRHGIDVAIGSLFIFDEEGLGGPKQLA